MLNLTHITTFLIWSFFAKLRVEEATLVDFYIFFGWVFGFFLSKDLTVLAKLFSLFSLKGGLRILREDYLSFIELSFTFIIFSYWVAQTFF